MFELPEPVQVVSVDGFHESCLVDCAPGVIVEKVPECGSKNDALEHHVPEEHLVRSLTFHDHLSGSLLQPGPRQIDQGRVNPFASEFLRKSLGTYLVKSPGNIRTEDSNFLVSVERKNPRHREVG